MIQLIVNGVDLSNYVVTSERNHCVCNPVASLKLLMEPNLPFTILPYQPMTFYENGVKVFTGYAYSVAKKRMPIECTVECMDELIRAKDYWFAKRYASNGESVGSWVNRFLDMSGIADRSISAGAAYQVFPGFGWQYMAALDAIVQTLQMCPYQIYADRNGTVRLVEMTRKKPTITISGYIEYERKRSDRWIRNRAVVLGATGIVADKFRSNPYLPNEVRTVVVATGQIYNAATASRIADEMLDEFQNPLDIKTVTIPGNPNLEIGQTARLIDSWSSYDAECVITSINTFYGAKTYETEVTLDERCPNFWGWDRPPPEYTSMYCGTWGRGVWRSDDTGRTWSQTELKNKQVYAIHVVDDDTVWASCKHGVFYTSTAGASWTTQNMGAPVDRVGVSESDLFWPGVVAASSGSAVYALAGSLISDGIWIYWTTDDGLNWYNARLV